MRSHPDGVGTADPSVAIVHDYLNQRGGAERVVLEIARMWRSAPLFTSLYRPSSTFEEYRDKDVRTSFLDRLPVDARFRTLAPLLPAAFSALGTDDFDLVLSSSSGWAHRVRTRAGATHVVYCYSPPWWIFPSFRVQPRPAQRRLLRPFLRAAREADRRAARRATSYLSIAENVRTRIKLAYGLESQVVYPPVNTDRFSATPRGDRLLVVSRLLPFKRVDIVIAAANRARLPLDVVGVGPSFDQLRSMAGPTVAFHGSVDDAALTELMESCRTVCVAGPEDFGIVAVEANAAGKPAVAFAVGGALETMQDGVTAALFSEPTVDAVLSAIERADTIDTAPGRLALNAQRFSTAVFRKAFAAAVERAMSLH